MRLRRRRFLHLVSHLAAGAAGAAALPAFSRFAVAETYPSRRITMVVPFAPGALSDIIARVMGEGMQALLGQTIVIENASGADGTIGTGRVARAVPDGYTLVVANWNTSVTNAAIYKLEYDVVKDFEPVVLLPAAPMVLIAKKANPATNLKEFIAWLKANPDKASMGTAGAGSPPDLLGRLLRTDTGTQLGLVAYRGAAPAMQDVIAGQIDAMFISIAAALPQVRSGNVKALGVTTHTRADIAPEIPTMDEAGLRGFYFALWAAIFAPRGTPKDIIDKLNAAAVKTLADPKVRQKLEAQGFEIPPPEQQTPAALAAYQKAEIEKWWPVVKAAGIKPE
jgi:tripartite-type tricarboxylate transporter receptor subunit TctC